MKPHKYTPDSLVEIDAISFTPPVESLTCICLWETTLGVSEGKCSVLTLTDHMSGSCGSYATLGDVDGVTRSNMARHEPPTQE